MSSRPLHPDRALEIALTGNATRLGHDLAAPQEAIELLRTMAAGRSDLLAEAAGRMLRSYLNNPTVSQPSAVYAAGLLVMAGAEPAAVAGFARS